MNIKSKKDLLMIGLVAAGGIGLASAFAKSKGEEGFGGGGGLGLGFGEEEEPGAMTKKETVEYASPTTGLIKPPILPSFSDIFKAPGTILNNIQRGGVRGDGVKKSSVTPYLYTGGEVRPGASTLAPWSAPPTVKPKQYFGGVVEAGHYTIAPWAGFKGGGGSSGSSKKGRASSKSVRRARATARHTAARKKRMSNR